MSRIEGRVGYHQLSEWWLSTFTAQEREYIEQVFQPLGSEPGSRPLTQGELPWTTATAAMSLWSLASWFMKPDDRHIARRILTKSEEVALAESDVMGLHFTYQHMVKVYYKDRDDPAALAAAIEACEKQIAIAPQVAEEFRKEVRDLAEGADPPLPESAFDLPAHVGFEQLAIILEKQKEYSRAIEICRLAETQGWGGTWGKRIEKCEKKLKKG